ncbi:myosin-9-like protein isoform X1 [Tanacetum coccineum]
MRRARGALEADARPYCIGHPDALRLRDGGEGAYRIGIIRLMLASCILFALMSNLLIPLYAQSFGGSPHGVNVSSNDGDSTGGSDSFRPLKARYPALLFKQQLTAYVEKTFGLIRDNLKREISPLLGLCIQGTARALANAASHEILLAHLLLRRECCSYTNGEYVRSGLAMLEHWCYKATEELSRRELLMYCGMNFIIQKEGSEGSSHEKVVRIPVKGGEILLVHETVYLEHAKALMNVKSKEEHELHLKLVLESLRKEKLYAKFSKCDFGRKMCIFLVTWRRHPQADGQSERMIQILEDIMRACVIDFSGSYHLNIRCAPFEALYGWKCRSLVLWAEIGESSYLDPKVFGNANLHVPLNEFKIDKTLRFIEEPIEIMDREGKSLKLSRIPLVKVHWNSKRGPEFT